MNAEQIVRALASQRAPIDVDYGACCFCGAFKNLHRRVPGGEGRPNSEDVPEAHSPDCPWRLAREWVSRVTKVLKQDSY